MGLELVGRKLGMTQIFNDAGERVPVTVVAAGPCRVICKKTPQTDGYSAVQLGFEEAREKKLSAAQRGHLAKAGSSPLRHLFEVRLSEKELEALEVGQELDAGLFSEGQRIDVSGRSKGSGFSGVVKRHGYATARATHGTHEFFRHGGAMAAGTYPGRIHPGKKMAGQHGNRRVTTVGLRVEKVDAEKGLIYVRGAIPGHRRGLVRIRTSVRGA